MKKLIIIIFLIIITPYLVVISIHNEKNEIFINVKINKKIKKIPIEKYVGCVLINEAPLSFNDEALKAISVAIRTYALKKMEDSDYIDGTTKYQVYSSMNNFNNKDKKKINSIVKSTRGEYMVYDDKIIDSLYFSTGVGKTENSEDIFVTELPYLKSVSSPWDNLSPVFNETLTFDKSDFFKKLGLKNINNLDINVLETTQTGRIKKIKINDKEFSGNEIRKKLNLKSTFFTIKKLDTNILITTTGYGHGVGMSEYGANGMANSGYNYIEILKHYYQGIKIKKIIV